MDIVLFDLIDYQNQRTGFDAENQKSVEYQTQYDVPDKTKAGMKISAYIIRLDAILTIMYVSTFITVVIFYFIYQYKLLFIIPRRYAQCYWYYIY